MPRRSSSSSRMTLPPCRPVKTAALSLRTEAGNPNLFEAERKLLATSRALTLGKQLEARATRERSSSQFKISTGVRSGSRQGAAATCQVSLGSLASKRRKDDRGRLRG